MTDPHPPAIDPPPNPTPIFDTLLAELGLAWTPDAFPQDRRGQVGWFEPTKASPAWPRH